MAIPVPPKTSATFQFSVPCDRCMKAPMALFVPTITSDAVTAAWGLRPTR